MLQILVVHFFHMGLFCLQIKSLNEVQQQYDLLYSNYDKLQHEYTAILDTLHDTEAKLDEALHTQENTTMKMHELKQTHDNMMKDKGDVYVQFQQVQDKLDETETALSLAHNENMDMDVNMKEIQFNCQQLTAEKHQLEVSSARS